MLQEDGGDGNESYSFGDGEILHVTRDVDGKWKIAREDPLRSAENVTIYSLPLWRSLSLLPFIKYTLHKLLYITALFCTLPDIYASFMCTLYNERGLRLMLAKLSSRSVIIHPRKLRRRKKKVSIYIAEPRNSMRGEEGREAEARIIVALL